MGTPDPPPTADSEAYQRLITALKKTPSDQTPKDFEPTKRYRPTICYQIGSILTLATIAAIIFAILIAAGAIPNAETRFGAPLLVVLANVGSWSLICYILPSRTAGSLGARDRVPKKFRIANPNHEEVKPTAHGFRFPDEGGPNWEGIYDDEDLAMFVKSLKERTMKLQFSGTVFQDDDGFSEKGKRSVEVEYETCEDRTDEREYVEVEKALKELERGGRFSCATFNSSLAFLTFD
ncbi:hypothetical protein HK097_009576 [Rhizophlyctis rosea]|uniref:Uncharacterized protein n=1 Tax=Rhizophlyctis rosea TaxID=64517 RepID=A0AAD5X4F6_9FUNG|nr:hypothetical protein HK097_009576 [Rhizophlyctis rosea]